MRNSALKSRALTARSSGENDHTAGWADLCAPSIWSGLHPPRVDPPCKIFLRLSKRRRGEGFRPPKFARVGPDPPDGLPEDRRRLLWRHEVVARGLGGRRLPPGPPIEPGGALGRRARPLAGSRRRRPGQRARARSFATAATFAYQWPPRFDPVSRPVCTHRSTVWYGTPSASAASAAVSSSPFALIAFGPPTNE